MKSSMWSSNKTTKRQPRYQRWEPEESPLLGVSIRAHSRHKRVERDLQWQYITRSNPCSMTGSYTQPTRPASSWLWFQVYSYTTANYGHSPGWLQMTSTSLVDGFKSYQMRKCIGGLDSHHGANKYDSAGWDGSVRLAPETSRALNDAVNTETKKPRGWQTTTLLKPIPHCRPS